MALTLTSTLSVTVLITTYNYGRFIEEGIDSVLAQEFPREKVQILVVDDGSTDDTAERIKKYGQRINYLRKPNGGQASALNLGFAEARGEIVCLLDADDLFLPGKLASVAAAFQQNPALAMVYHRLEEWHTGTDERREWEFVEVSGDIQREPEEFRVFMPQPTSGISFRRSALTQLLPIPEQIRMLADCYVVALVPFIAPILAIPELLTVYRIHGGNQYTRGQQQESAEGRRKKLEMWQVVIEAMRKWLADNGHTHKEAPVRAMLDQWTNILEREEFGVAPPGRIRFFRHLLRVYKCRWPLMTGRLCLINGFNVLGSLIVGYEKFHWLDRGREGVTRWVRSLTGKRSATGPSQVPR